MKRKDRVQLEGGQAQKRVKAFAIANGEIDTYERTDETAKKAIADEDIANHWKLRSQRRGVQAVMSARHSTKENRAATVTLQKEIFEFLAGYVEGKGVFELGVGIGRMTRELAKVAHEVQGCDFSPEMLRKAERNLRGHKNIRLAVGKITDIELPSHQFDLVFDSIVLLHILSDDELRRTALKMMEISGRVFIVEHTYEGPNFPISKYTRLRKPEEYESIFQPYRLVKQKTHFCAGDRFTMMLFEK